jgi:hypothetical protein
MAPPVVRRHYRREIEPPIHAGRSRPFGAAAPAALKSTRRQLARLLAATLAWPGTWAQALERPSGPVLLTITGRVRKPNAGVSAVFDMAMLERLPQHSFVTRTPWYSTPRKFTGPLLRDVLAACGAQGSTLRALALNDYRVDLPFEDAHRHELLLARLLDDKPMAVRDKGPLFLIYPFDSSAELRSVVYYSRSAWQLKSIEVR